MRLNIGDKVGVCATAKVVDESAIRVGVSIIESWGLEVVVAPQVFWQFGYFAGEDRERSTALQMLLDDEDIKAIFFARGGYGTTRILDQLDFTKFKKSPKILIGFSDLTAMHLAGASMGISGIHGPMVQHLPNLDEDNLAIMKELLFEDTYSYRWNAHSFKAGTVKGPLTGGNLNILCHSIGSLYPPKLSGSILFLEEVGENLYVLDRMMQQLRRSGVLHEITGFIGGQFTDLSDSNPAFGKNVEEIIMEYIQPLSIPFALDFSAGHAFPNWPLYLGQSQELKINKLGDSSLIYNKNQKKL